LRGGAAVLVGTRSEVDQARKRLETEGVAKDLETYLRLHKELVVPSDFLKDNRYEKLADAVGYFRVVDNFNGKNTDIEYIDSNGNFARVEILCDLIDDVEIKNKQTKLKNDLEYQRSRERNYSEADYLFNLDRLKEVLFVKLEKLGFKKAKDPRIIEKFTWAKENYRDWVENKLIEQAKNEFDF